jgi:hypothetical protein
MLRTIAMSLLPLSASNESPHFMNTQYVLNLANVRLADIGLVGGKNASLGEMMSGLSDAGIRVPGGFATTAQAYREFLAQNGLDARIARVLTGLNVPCADRAECRQCGSTKQGRGADTRVDPGAAVVARLGT